MKESTYAFIGKISVWVILQPVWWIFWIFVDGILGGGGAFGVIAMIGWFGIFFLAPFLKWVEESVLTKENLK